MIVLKRKLGGLLCYKKVYFARDDQAHDILTNVRPNEVVRLFAAPANLEGQRCVVSAISYQAVYNDLTIPSREIYRRMRASRSRLNRAEKMRERVRIEVNSARAFTDFLPLYNSFAQAKGPVPRLTRRRLLEYTGVSDVLVLYLDSRPLCCHLVLRDQAARIAQMQYSGSARFESAQAASACGDLNRYLHWYEFQMYQQQGFELFSLGGIRHPKHPTARFKLELGGTVVSENYYVVAGIPWIGRAGNGLYQRFSRAWRPIRENSPGKAVNPI